MDPPQLCAVFPRVVVITFHISWDNAPVHAHEILFKGPWRVMAQGQFLQTSAEVIEQKIHIVDRDDYSETIQNSTLKGLVLY